MQDGLMFFPLTKSELHIVIKEAVNEVLIESKKQNQKEVLNSKELCSLLGISESTLNKWKAENKIPYKRLGKRIFFSRAEVFGALKDSNYSRLKELGA